MWRELWIWLTVKIREKTTKAGAIVFAVSHPIKIMPDLSAAKATAAYTSGAATKSKVA